MHIYLYTSYTRGSRQASVKAVAVVVVAAKKGWEGVVTALIAAP